MKDEFKIAAAYIRVSTDKQTELSPASQIKEIRDYAKRHNMIVPDEFIFSDEGISGRLTKKRDGFKTMIACAKTKPKPFDVILLWKFSRFARNRQDSIVFKSLLRKELGIEVISISEDLGDNKMAVLFEAQIEAMDEYYSINLSEEVKRGMIEKVSRGGAVAGPAFGYDMINKEYAVNEKEADIVREIYQRFVNGDGCRTLATWLNSQGVKTKRGGVWENRTIEYIIRNPVYIGKIRWNSNKRTRRNYDDENIIITDGIHKPIITNEIWEQANLMLNNQKKLYSKYSHRDSIANEYMLRGVMKCSRCGGSLTYSSGGLQCHNYAHSKCDESHYISLPIINDIVLNSLEELLKSGTFEIIPRPVADLSFNKINDELEREQSKLLRIKEAFEAGVDSLVEYKANKKRIMNNIERLQSKLTVRIKTVDKKAFAKQHLKTLKSLRDVSLSEKDKNLLLRSFVHSITFDRKKTGISVVFNL